MAEPTDLKTRRRLAILFSLPFGLCLVFFILTGISDRNDLELQRVQNLNLCIARLRSLSADIEIGEHGFILTGNDQYLVPLEEANANLAREVRSCSQLAETLPAVFSSRVSKLADLIGQQTRQASSALDTYHRSGSDAALAAVNNERSAADTANRVRQAAEDLESRVSGRELEVLHGRRLWNRFSYIVFVLGTLGLVFLLVRLFHAATSYLHGRDRLQNELKQLNAALESQVDERTRDLTAANEELQQFAYVASHDLQEPLRTVVSFTQLLQSRYRNRLDADADEFMGYIVNASRRMTDLINGLLALARLRKEGQIAASISFSDLVEEVRSNLAIATRESGASITNGPLPELAVNRVQIVQLMQNLVSNSIKYRRDGVSPAIHITAERDNTHWTFKFHDNGRGFDQQFAERIFGLFQRLSGGVDGTGIGLSIARKIVERHGGRIWAQSQPGQSATFYFSLPVSLEVSRTEQPSAPPIAAQAR